MTLACVAQGKNSKNAARLIKLRNLPCKSSHVKLHAQAMPCIITRPNDLAMQSKHETNRHRLAL
jgi:hypothetical protein